MACCKGFASVLNANEQYFIVSDVGFHVFLASLLLPCCEVLPYLWAMISAIMLRAISVGVEESRTN